MPFCPECNRIIEYDSYFDKYYCTSCSWRSKKVNKKILTKKIVKSKNITDNKFLFTIQDSKLILKDEL